MSAAIDEPGCATCGGEMVRVRCDHCEDGFTEPGELHEEDPLWYDEDDTMACVVCDGTGGWWVCGNSKEWCQAHPTTSAVEAAVCAFLRWGAEP